MIDENYDHEDDDEDIETIGLSDAYERYDEMLDDAYGDVEIFGMSWDASTVLKRVDPIAYDVGFNDFVSDAESNGYFKLDY